MRIHSLAALLCTIALVACTTAAPQEQTETVQMSFMDLWKLGKNYLCTFDETDSVGTQNVGRVFVEQSGQNLRGDFAVTEADGTSYDAHVIRKGSMSYVWTSQQAQGLKMEVHDEELFGVSNSGKNMGIKEGEPVSFDCNAWAIDSSVFTPPTNVDFVDAAMMMQGGVPGGGSMEAAKQAQCASCDQIADPGAKLQCRTALGCS